MAIRATIQKTTLVSIILILLAPIIAWVGVAGAQSFRSGDNVTVTKDQRVDGTLWMSGRNLDIAGTVDGDIFCASQHVSISGTVNGDVLCAAQTIRISGTVNGDVRLAGQSVTVSSSITDNASIAAQTVSLEQGSSIGRDASIAGSEITANGRVGRDAALTASQVVIAGNVGRNIKASVERLRLETNATVGGDLTYTSANRADITKGAAVAGATHRYEPAKENSRGKLPFLGILLNLYMVVSLLLIALAFVLVLPRLFHSVSEVAVNAPLKTFLVGLVAAIVFPVVCLALLLTVIGIPLALFLLLIWLVIFSFGCLFFNYYIGRLVLPGHPNPIIIMLVGSLIVLIAYLIPFVGGLVFLASTWFGIGMVLLNLQSRYERPAYKMVTVQEPIKPARIITKK